HLKLKEISWAVSSHHVILMNHTHTHTHSHSHPVLLFFTHTHTHTHTHTYPHTHTYTGMERHPQGREPVSLHFLTCWEQLSLPGQRKVSTRAITSLAPDLHSG